MQKRSKGLRGKGSAGCEQSDESEEEGGGGGKEESSTLKESSRLYLCVIRGVREEI